MMHDLKISPLEWTKGRHIRLSLWEKTTITRGVSAENAREGPDLLNLYHTKATTLHTGVFAPMEQLAAAGGLEPVLSRSRNIPSTGCCCTTRELTTSRTRTHVAHQRQSDCLRWRWGKALCAVRTTPEDSRSLPMQDVHEPFCSHHEAIRSSKRAERETGDTEEHDSIAHGCALREGQGQRWGRVVATVC